MNRVFIDDLPAIGVSRLRASGAIAAETTEYLVKLGRCRADRRRHVAPVGAWRLMVLLHRPLLRPAGEDAAVIVRKDSLQVLLHRSRRKISL